MLEFGAYDVNGSVRPLLEHWGPSEYVGLDIQEGPGVDVVCRAEDAAERFGNDRFDLVVSTEMIEHVRDWREVISNIKNVCKADGIMLLAAPSHDFPYHGYPHDFWRYEAEDLRAIFADCEILSVVEEKRNNNVCIKVRKPQDFRHRNLAEINLYSVITHQRCHAIDESALRGLRFRCLTLRHTLRELVSRIYSLVFGQT